MHEQTVATNISQADVNKPLMSPMVVTKIRLVIPLIAMMTFIDIHYFKEYYTVSIYDWN